MIRKKEKENGDALETKRLEKKRGLWRGERGRGGVSCTLLLFARVLDMRKGTPKA